MSKLSSQLQIKIAKVLDFVETQQQYNDGAHRIDHIRSVIANCTKIFDEINCRQDLVLIAACLHDIVPRAGLRKAANAADQSAVLANRFLPSLGFSKQLSMDVAECIRTSAWEFHTAGGKPSSIESHVLRDADLLEAIGAHGISRVFVFAGAHKLPLVCSEHGFTKGEKTTLTKNGLDKTPFQHIHRKLLHVRSLIHSETAKIEAEQRHKYLLQFLEQYKSETEWSKSRDLLPDPETSFPT